MRRISNRFKVLILLFLLCTGSTFLLYGALGSSSGEVVEAGFKPPKWSGKAAVTVNDNEPSFTKKQKTSQKEYALYSELDEQGRAQRAIGCLGPKTVNDGERQSIGQIKPSGWKQEKYKGIIDSEPPYLYNRGHLLMQAAAAGIKAEECNSEKNLISMTRYCNVDGMLPYEVKILNYIRSTGNHVIYRVTPVYKEDQLVARGVRMEAYSIEDKGKGICFSVYAFNLQPGITIKYSSGASSKKKDYRDELVLAVKNGATTVDIESVGKVSSKKTNRKKTKDAGTQAYVLNNNTKRFHDPDCPSVKTIKAKNREDGKYKRSDLIDRGYKPCGNCNP